MTGYLILENGEIFEGERIGCVKDTCLEVVFNTSMSGYQKVFTDPSYASQGVVMTYPLIRKLRNNRRRLRIKKSLGKRNIHTRTSRNLKQLQKTKRVKRLPNRKRNTRAKKHKYKKTNKNTKKQPER